MPHSPRVHRGALYVLDSGGGYFGKVDRKSGKFEPIAFTPGYARGMGIIGDFAIVGLSKCRENRTFSGLTLDRGGYVVSQDLKTGGNFPNTDPDDHWWIPAGRVFLSPDSAHTAPQERTYAQSHFFLAHRYRDPFHNIAVSTESNSSVS